MQCSYSLKHTQAVVSIPFWFVFTREWQRVLCKCDLCLCWCIIWQFNTTVSSVQNDLCMSMCCLSQFGRWSIHSQKKKLKITHAQLAKARKTNYVTQKKVTCTQHTQPKLLRLKYVQLTPDGQNVGSINATLTHRLELTATHLYT